MKDVTALMVVGWALTLAACGGGPSATTTTTEAPEAATSTTVFVEPVTSTQQLNPGSFLDTPNEINLENNITVFFRRDAVAGVVEAESALRDLVGDRDIVSMQVLDRDEAWGTAQNIASLFPGGRLDPGDFDGLAQVARIFVVDRDVRNALTDELEDSPLLAGVGYVVGLRPAGDGAAFEPSDTWELLAYFWTP